MKAILYLNGLKARMAFIVLIVVSLFLSSCDKKDDPNPEPKPEPTPVAAVVSTDSVNNVTKTAAAVYGSIVAGELGTTVALEYCGPDGSWTSVNIPLSLTAANLQTKIKLTFDLPSLQNNTVYTFRLKAKNKAGEVTSPTAKFWTYAVADFDGNFYHTVKIGNQIWLRENFKGTHFANGDPIPNTSDFITTPAYCWYNNDPKLGKIYGGLYNWYVVNDSRGLIVGYHVPSEDEWRTLIAFVGDVPNRFMEPGTDHWSTNLGTNESGFTAIGAGSRNNIQSFINLNVSAIFWASTSFDLTTAWENDIVSYNIHNTQSGGGYKGWFYSLRLVKNN